MIERGELERRGFHAKRIVEGFEEEFVKIFLEVVIGMPDVEIV